jgi:hypothetical protein
MKNVLVVGAFLLAALIAGPANAAGCKHGDTLVKSGPHAGQCAHTGASTADLGDPDGGDAMTPPHQSPEMAGPKKAEQRPHRGPAPASRPAKVAALTVQHPFPDIDIKAQYRCIIVGGAPVRDEKGTGWCHD